MDFTLFVGDYAYSSWSLRGWLLLDAFGLPATLRHAHMRTPAFDALLSEIAPSRTVPALAFTDHTQSPRMVWDSLAIAETVHEYHPQAGLWPKGDRARPAARAVAAEMHSGFTALRGACPMNMRRAYEGFEVGDDVRADLARLDELWEYARARGTGEGAFLFGAFSAADAFYAPVASRIATYGLPVSEAALAYVAALLGHDSVRRWRAMGMADPYVQSHYEFDLPHRANPHEPNVRGEPIDSGTAENAFCPFTGGDPVVLVRVQDRVLGFGDVFNRDKVAHDPLCWAEVRALLEV